MCAAPLASSPDPPFICLNSRSLSVLSSSILLLLLTLLPVLEPAFLGFQHELRTHSSPEALQAFHVRLGLLRQPASWTD